MKKRILAIAIVLTLCIGLLPAAAFAADCEHEYTAESCYCALCGELLGHKGNSHNKTETQHQFYCGCGYVAEWADHVDEDGVTGCDVCWYGCTHEDIRWDYNAYEHCGNCMGCYTTIYMWEEHNMVDDVCTVCGYEACKHERGVAHWVLYKYYHTGLCGECGMEIVIQAEHLMTDGTCTVCGMTPCADGEHVYTEEWGDACSVCHMLHDHVNEDGDCVCDICGAGEHQAEWVIEEADHVLKCVNCDYEEYREAHYDTDGVGGCDICCYGCTHVNSDCFIYEDGHSIVCNDCGEWLVDWAEHTLENGICTGCGVELCTDGHVPSEEDAHTCAECGAWTYCDDADGDCSCDICDADMSFFILIGGDTHHWNLCLRCGDIQDYAEHTDADSDGMCDSCGYGCSHERALTWLSHTNHWFECALCGNNYNFGIHTDDDDDGLCDGCTYDGIHVIKKMEAVPATCQAEGIKEHYTCEGCGLLYSDAEGTTEITAESLVIEKLAHETELVGAKEATCTAVGYSGDLVCKNCKETVEAGKEVAMKLHDYKDGVCTVCKAKDPVFVKVEQAENVPQVSVDVPTQELMTEEDKAAIEAGTTVTVSLTVENADETVDEETKTKVESVVESLNAGAEPPEGENPPADVPAEQPKSETKVAMYLDINLTKTVGEAETPITETEAMVGITVDVPEVLQDAGSRVDRVFSVLRYHEGQVDVLEDLDDDPTTVTIQTDRFSTYVLVYTDTQKAPVADPTNPDTGDHGIALISACVALASVLGMAVLTGKKKNI